ncbi:MAG: hypothetical protein QM811_23760 [Pirellulales bacterium]
MPNKSPSRTNRLFRELLKCFENAAVNNYMGDGFLATLHVQVSDAVKFALLFHRKLATAAETSAMPDTRIGEKSHIGEISMLVDGTISGQAADMCARLMSLGGGRQTLLTRPVFDDARQHVRVHPIPKKPNEREAWKGGDPPARMDATWSLRVQLGKDDETVDVCEVGAIGFAPLKAPSDSEKAKRKLDSDEETTLGWRPAVGQECRKRRWLLQKHIGQGGFGGSLVGDESGHAGETIFSTVSIPSRRRSFKRELALVMLLRKELGDRPDIGKIFEIRIDHPPYFLELDYSPLGNLKDWSEQQGGIISLSIAQRWKCLGAYYATRSRPPIRSTFCTKTLSPRIS